MIQKVILALSLVLGSQIAMAEQGKYQEGIHYFKIDQAVDESVSDTVEVTEIFSYACTHCNTFEPYMQSWKKSKPEYARLNRLPVAFGRRAWALLAQGYIAAEMMGIAEQSHVPMMDAIWKERRQFSSVDELADFYSGFGVEKDAYIGHFKSFAADSQMRKSQRDVQLFGITGTPSMVVNRKYRVASNKDVRSFEAMLDVVNYLVELEHASSK
ncbi:MAG: thiol:disulfide interchange protein DsbA/DsbL [Gammaproteobacteria bacterium]|nr:MAG: thiol:disulfide interchange protein DsbA/DsbL [Gammaproteobacteria bacterium]